MVIFIIFMAFCLILYLLGIEVPDPMDKSKDKKSDIEEEMDTLELEEWQKDLVREGRFAPWSFKKKSTSSEPLSDGQYYKDDSDN